MNAWSSYEDEVTENYPVFMDAYCENVVVWRIEGMSARIRQKLHVAEGEINFSRVFAKSGSGREEIGNENVDEGILHIVARLFHDVDVNV